MTFDILDHEGVRVTRCRSACSMLPGSRNISAMVPSYACCSHYSGMDHDSWSCFGGPPCLHLTSSVSYLMKQAVTRRRAWCALQNRPRCHQSLSETELTRATTIATRYNGQTNSFSIPCCMHSKQEYSDRGHHAYL